MDTVLKTRAASASELAAGLSDRCNALIADGLTTCEVKSGYGLTVRDELKMLRAIQHVNEVHDLDLIPTALAAHVRPPEFVDPGQYIQVLMHDLLPEIRRENLSGRVDVYIDTGAFDPITGRLLLGAAQDLGFSITVHADQFAVGGSTLACEFQAVSSDHLEASGIEEIRRLVQHNVIGTILPGASLGLGMPFAPVRVMLDAGLCVAIASDYNPGSAPMGDLLLQAALLGAAEKLTLAETLAGITIRAARALELSDRGVLETGKLADLIAFPCSDYREILYRQGKMKPDHVWKSGKKVK